MPELAEIKIMGDFINEVSHSSIHKSILINPRCKVKTDLSRLKDKTYTLQSSTRGKELKLSINTTTNEQWNLYFSMGMNGNWTKVNSIDQIPEEYGKHIKLIFPSSSGYLLLYDTRNFAKWKWSNDWSKSRGPCPLSEASLFKQNLEDVILNPKIKILDYTPLHELLLNQKYFNGIGNYLRSTILNRLQVNPFYTIKQLSESEIAKLCFLCYEIPRISYNIGGGYSNANISSILDCYGRRDLGWVTSVRDKNNRTFWFNKKWTITPEFKKYIHR